MAATIPADFTRADYPQPHCPICGRFAYRRGDGTWALRCTFWDDYSGGWEHE